MFVCIDRKSAGKSRSRRAARWSGFVVAALLVAFLVAPLASAQDWGDDSSEDWAAERPAKSETQPARASGTSRASSAAAGWSLQGGFGFTASPEAFLLNFEAPYAFNEWISAGPTLQLGLHDKRTIVAPTGSIRLTVPDLPGRELDRLHPYIQTGIGFAYIDRDQNQHHGDGAGLLVNLAAGVEYQVSEKVFLGSQMMFNILPKETQDESFFFSWQLAGIRFKF